MSSRAKYGALIGGAALAAAAYYLYRHRASSSSSSSSSVEHKRATTSATAVKLVDLTDQGQGQQEAKCEDCKDRDQPRKVPYQLEREVAVQAVLLACRLCQATQDAITEEMASATTKATKTDSSPVTIADYGSQALINLHVRKQLPSIPVVAEEDTSLLKANKGLLDRVVSEVNRYRGGGEPVSADSVMAAIDYGSYQGGKSGTFWALDPIDGTLGFLRKGQYAIALGLIVDGQVVLGVMGCPNLPVDPSKPDGAKGCIFVGGLDHPAVQIPLHDLSHPQPIRVSTTADSKDATFTESVEASHSSHDHAALIAKKLNISRSSVRMDSQAKYAVLARGQADLYLRLPTRKGYEECIWDHAAGQAVLQAAGGTITDTQGKLLDFSLGRKLTQNIGVVASNTRLHATVMSAVKAVL